MRHNSTEEDINDRVDQVLDQVSWFFEQLILITKDSPFSFSILSKLYLRPLEDSRIGNPKMTGIAQGERRRLSFACGVIS